MNQRENLTELICESDRAEMDYDEMADLGIANGFVDLSHLALLDIEEDYRSFRIPKIVLFNENQVTQEEALRVVRAGEYNENVLVVPKRQWVSLFLNTGEV